MRLYSLMQRLPWPNSYVGRLLFICFIGTHIPLLVLCGWALISSRADLPLSALLVVLCATLGGSAFTLAALRAMLKPVIRSAKALENYAASKEKPALPTGFRDEAGRLMATVQATILQLDGKVSEITRAAMTDELTGVHNRRWLNEIGIPRMEAEHRKGMIGSLLVIDLDNFKTVNDTWGHSLGDQVLIVVADAIRAALRERDHVVRTGGDEFCVMLPGADATILEEIAERLRVETARLTSSLAIDHAVTMSIGGTTTRKADASFIEIYRRADANLYDVKTSGRNAFSAGLARTAASRDNTVRAGNLRTVRESL